MTIFILYMNKSLDEEIIVDLVDHTEIKQEVPVTMFWVTDGKEW